MASITIRDLEDEVVARLRARAAGRRRTVEEEARVILREAVGDSDSRPRDLPRDLAESTREHFAPLGGVELELPPRGPMRKPPHFC